jgi:type II secretory pathway component GspD/PulD (secretin)
VRFSFQGQPWLDVLEWLARISDLSLDWQELPAGFLNLRTRQSYSKEEARDLINRHLLDRGFTLLRHGEILSVVNVKKLDPSLVPRLAPEELDQAQPHDFARVSFALDWLPAESAVEEFKPLVSPNGKLAALKSTNRLEAIDAVANLREIRRLVTEEESPRGRKRLVREFKLEHVRAGDVQPQLHKLLGLDKSGSGAAPQNADPAAIVQQMAQILQRGQESGKTRPQKQQQPQQQVQLIVDVRANTILAHAPPDQMAVIAEAIRAIDKPSDRSRSLVRNAHRVQVYPLAVADPEALIKMLNDLADLDPGTRLQVDKKRRAVVAHAPLADHLTIRMLVDKVDGKARKFRTISLQRLDAEYVAGSIDLVMGGGDATKKQPGREAEDEARRFRVVADVENNRLLAWVNDGELEEVRQLLAELGEPAASGRANLAVRVLEKFDGPQTIELLRRLQEIWPEVAPNPLEFGPGTEGPDAAAPKRDSRGASRGAPPAESVRLTAHHRSGPSDSIVPAAVTETDDIPAAASKGESNCSPVRINRDSSGHLIVSSEDAAALERIRKLVGEIVPSQSDFKVFRMKHKESSVYLIAENLKQYFDEKEKRERPVTRFYDPAAGKSTSGPREADGRKQATRRQPKFIVDSESNSILAVGADSEQLEVIDSLVELYDSGGSREPKPTRISRIIEIKHATARAIADAVKDVYRDLLTVEAPAPKNGEPQVRRPEPTYTYAYSLAGAGGEISETLVKFKGQLSIGLDESSNTVIVSAPEALLANVVETIESLDEISRATAPRIRVVKLSRDVHPGEFQKRLQRLLTKPQSPHHQSQSQQRQ